MALRRIDFIPERQVCLVSGVVSEKVSISLFCTLTQGRLRLPVRRVAAPMALYLVLSFIYCHRGRLLYAVILYFIIIGVYDVNVGYR
ncbi:hypothetical protein [Sodalis praecaptivus]|uniref:hypothetical protein n=1 Tax=Sodalis praecaptivus TaxID=1239307 RepID=UPI00046CEAB5|nr:hypothetical protein [Sodalis praecaptivus]